jgi:hypothetical protein
VPIVVITVNAIVDDFGVSVIMPINSDLAIAVIDFAARHEQWHRKQAGKQSTTDVMSVEHMTTNLTGVRVMKQSRHVLPKKQTPSRTSVAYRLQIESAVTNCS